MNEKHHYEIVQDVQKKRAVKRKSGSKISCPVNTETDAVNADLMKQSRTNRVPRQDKRPVKKGKLIAENVREASVVNVSKVDTDSSEAGLKEMDTREKSNRQDFGVTTKRTKPTFKPKVRKVLTESLQIVCGVSDGDQKNVETCTSTSASVTMMDTVPCTVDQWNSSTNSANGIESTGKEQLVKFNPEYDGNRENDCNINKDWAIGKISGQSCVQEISKCSGNTPVSTWESVTAGQQEQLGNDQLETILPCLKASLPHLETTLSCIETTLPHLEATLLHPETSLLHPGTTVPHLETTLLHFETNVSQASVDVPVHLPNHAPLTVSLAAICPEDRSLRYVHKRLHDILGLPTCAKMCVGSQDIEKPEEISYDDTAVPTGGDVEDVTCTSEGVGKMAMMAHVHGSTLPIVVPSGATRSTVKLSQQLAQIMGQDHPLQSEKKPNCTTAADGLCPSLILDMGLHKPEISCLGQNEMHIIESQLNHVQVTSQALVSQCALEQYTADTSDDVRVKGEAVQCSSEHQQCIVDENDVQPQQQNEQLLRNYELLMEDDMDVSDSQLMQLMNEPTAMYLDTVTLPTANARPMDDVSPVPDYPPAPSHPTDWTELPSADARLTQILSDLSFVSTNLQRLEHEANRIQQLAERAIDSL